MKYSCKSELTYQQCGCLSLTIETKPKEQQVVAHYVTLHGNDPNTDTKLLPCMSEKLILESSTEGVHTYTVPLSIQIYKLMFIHGGNMPGFNGISQSCNPATHCAT